MPPTPSSSLFFGFDLAALWADFRASWQRAHQWPLLAWLSPDAPVRVLRTDGTEAVWIGQNIALAKEIHKKPRFEAIELPADILLVRSLVLPAMPEEQIVQAVALEVTTVSPFPAVDLVWGYASTPRSVGGGRIEIALASRKQVIAYVDAQRGRLQGNDAEVWAISASGHPAVFAGWGESHRAQYCANRRRIGYGLVFSAFLLVVAIAVTPVAQLRLRAIEAAIGYSELQAKTAPAVAERESFVRTSEKLKLLHDILSDRADGLRLMEMLTTTLSDDTYLHSLEVNGLTVRMTGLTSNAASLMQQLGAQQGFKDVRAPVAATRNPGATLDSFNIEFQLDPALLSAAGSAGGSSKSDMAAAPVAAVAATAGAAGSEASRPKPDATSAAAASALGTASPPTKSLFSSGASTSPTPAPVPSLQSATSKAKP